MRAVAAVVLLAGLAAAIGHAPATAPLGAPEPAILGKPNPAVGTLDVTILERPTPDRAWVRAVWTRGPDAANCRLLFFPGRDASIVDGHADQALAADAPTGEVFWLVDFAVDRPLEAVVRLCAQTSRGVHACEAYVPLVRSAPR